MTRTNVLVTLLLASLSGNAAFLISTGARVSRASEERPALVLTPEQRTRFNQANEAFLVERAAAHRKLAELRAALADEFTKDAPDQDRLREVSSRMAELQTERRPALVEHLLFFHALLSPPQRLVLADDIRNHKGACCGACPGSGLFAKRRNEP